VAFGTWMSRAPFPIRPGSEGKRPTAGVKGQVRPAMSTAGASRARAETGGTPSRTNPLAASRTASSAPIESPHRYTRRDPRRERSASRAASSISPRVTVSRASGVRPWPGSTGPTARNPARASDSPTGRSSDGAPVNPCRSRHASAPSPRLNGAAASDIAGGRGSTSAPGPQTPCYERWHGRESTAGADPAPDRRSHRERGLRQHGPSEPQRDRVRHRLHLRAAAGAQGGGPRAGDQQPQAHEAIPARDAGQRREVRGAVREDRRLRTGAAPAADALDSTATSTRPRTPVEDRATSDYREDREGREKRFPAAAEAFTGKHSSRSLRALRGNAFCRPSDFRMPVS